MDAGLRIKCPLHVAVSQVSGLLGHYLSVLLHRQNHGSSDPCLSAVRKENRDAVQMSLYLEYMLE